MQQGRSAGAVEPAADRPGWSTVLRAIRKARGVTQEGWAAWLGVSRITVQRWERGEVVPDARAEEAILAYCREKGLFEHPDGGLLRGLVVTPEALRDLLAAARLGNRHIQPVARIEAGNAGAPSLPHLAPGNLPVPLTSFIGREREMVTVRGALAATRLLTLIGPGGVGKTRLALQVAAEVAAEFADGVTVVALAPIRDPELVVAAIVQTLQVREAAGRSPRDGLIAALRDRQALLLLDNFEQVLDAAPLVTELLAACPRLKALVTSRAALRLSGEHQFSVAPLALPDPERLPPHEVLARYAAVALFVQRAQAVMPRFALTDANASAVAEICARLDGLPLAIELAAVRVKLLPPQTLLERLGSRLGLLTHGARDLAPRQQALRATVDWSHDLLDAVEQTFFRRLATFVGGATLEAIEAVCGDDGGDSENSALDVVASLVDQSLVQHAESGGGEPRFVMLETVHEYARERLEASQEREALRKRHAAYYLTFAERAASELRRAQQVTWLERLGREYGNLRAALEWSLDRGAADTSVRLSGALGGFWDARSYLSEGRSWLARALAADGGGPAARITALNWASYFACLQGDYAQAQTQAEQGLALCRKRGSKRGAGYALLMLGQVATEQGDSGQAVRLWEESLQALREAGDLWGMARPLNNLGELARARGDYARARALHEEALKVRRELGDKGGLPNVLCDLGQVMWRQGDYPAARALAREALVLSEEVGSKLSIAVALEVLAIVRAMSHQPKRAARLWGAAEALREAIGTPLEAIDRDDYERVVTEARAGLGDEPFTAAWVVGREMSPEQVIAEALAAEETQ